MTLAVFTDYFNKRKISFQNASMLFFIYHHLFGQFLHNGTSLVMLDDRNTVGSRWILFDYESDPKGNSYYNGNQISMEAHTHSSSSDPSDTDIAVRNNYSGMEHAIYYNGAFYGY